jgi:restriction endonuclease S subunit
MKDISDVTSPSYATAIRAAGPKDKQSLLREGDLVFRSRGRSTGAALVGGDAPPAILAAPLLLIRPLYILPEFLWWFINCDETQAQLASVAVGTSGQMITAESLRALPVPVPPKEAQRRIAEVAHLIRRDEELVNEITRRRKQLAIHILMNYARQGAKEANR